MIHIIQQFTNAFGGTEIHALNLYNLLQRQTAARLWSEFDPDPRLAKWPIDLIRPKRLGFPKTGTFVFVGACWYVGPWLEYAFPRRIIVLHNYCTIPTNPGSNAPSGLDTRKSNGGSSASRCGGKQTCKASS